MVQTQLALNTLFNCLQVSSNIAHYMKTDCDQVVQHFTSSTNFNIRITATFILSFMERKLLVSQRHHLRFSDPDPLIVLEKLSQSLLTENIYSSPISLLKGLQSAIVAEHKNVEDFTLPELLSIISEAMASANSDVQREAIILLWKLSSIPPYTEKIKLNVGIIKTIQNLQGSDNPTVALASTCVLSDLMGRKISGTFTLLSGQLVLVVCTTYSIMDYT